jgi:CheY-like chemotaxis protein
MSEPATPKRILVVDDEPDVVKYLEAILIDNGYQPITTNDGSRALELAREHQPDLICLDIAMPEPTGVRIYRDLRDDPLLASIPVLRITGVMPQFKDFIHRRKHLKQPDGYISKPFDVKELLGDRAFLCRRRRPEGAGAAPAPEAAMAKRRVLLVDDDEMFTATVATVLEDRYEVSTAASGAEALERIGQNPPDLVVLDVMMEALETGFDVARKLKSDPATAAIPIVMLTGVDQVYDMSSQIDDGWIRCDRYIEKPPDPRTLLATIAELLGG